MRRKFMTSSDYIHLIVSLWAFVACLTHHVQGESSTCLTVYREGGAPAVFRSPKCPRWRLSGYGSRQGSPPVKCQSAMLQGRRRSQEDRILCALNIRIPFPGPFGVTEVTAAIAAVFDGHNGAEASEMASKLLVEYFTLHTYFLLDATFAILLKNTVGRLPGKQDEDFVSEMFGWDEELEQHLVDYGRFKLSLSAIFDEEIHLKVLKKSLLRAIRDIDAAFSTEAHRNNLESGSTATVALIADGQVLVANVGDSKAVLCSETYQSPSDSRASLLRLYKKKRQDGAVTRLREYGGFKLASSSGLAYFSAKELTRDHHPDRDDERSRVESAGGYIMELGGVYRINGQLAVSRAIGDLPFKRYGVISAPEVTDWQPLTANDSYLVVASDGVFEKLGPQDVCDILWESHTQHTDVQESTFCCFDSLADCIVNAAYGKGSMDNMAAIVIPFRSVLLSQCLPNQRHDEVKEFEKSTFGLAQHVDEWTDMENAHPVISKFNRLLVEGRQSKFGCFYLYKNLNDYDYSFWVQKDKQKAYEPSRAFHHALDHHYYGGSLNKYNDNSMCLDFGITANEDRDQCMNLEAFANFLGLLESIPMHDYGLNHESSVYTIPDSKYVLKRRFGHGSYGEVWLAFNWNCSQGNQTSNGNLEENKFVFSTVNPTPHDENPQTRSSFSHDHSDDNMFILKRIMVEKGANVYLSGLREKHFGEVFLNASSCLGVSRSAKSSESIQMNFEPNLYDSLKVNGTAFEEIENPWNMQNKFTKSRLSKSSYEEGLNHIARYIESFESQSNEIWLVFRHEGVSLSKLLYTAEELDRKDDEEIEQHARRVQVLHPSKWWHWMKTTKAGQEEMRNIIWQLLMALKSCHDRNITHRDIKPENMVVCFEDDFGTCLKGIPAGDGNYSTKMRIIDFGSALDEFTVKHLYGSGGPSRAEQTHEYTPPEAFLNASWYGGLSSTTLKYDMWSVGVVILELIIGSPDVFQISALTRTLLDKYLEGWNDSLKELAYRLRAYMELCILIPGSSAERRFPWRKHNKGAASPASWKCSEAFFSHQIKSRDPLKIGFPNVLALRLVRQLLLWHPEDRLSVDDALQHPYFSSPSRKGWKT